jgi:hypothetical protein
MRLHQNSLKLHSLQQQAQGLDLATGIGGIGALGIAKPRLGE